MTLPEIRTTLVEIIDKINCCEIDIDEILVLLEHLSSEIPRRRMAPRKRIGRSKKVTTELAEKIVAYVEANPDVTHNEVAKIHEVNNGRVSEILYGKRS